MLNDVNIFIFQMWLYTQQCTLAYIIVITTVLKRAIQTIISRAVHKRFLDGGGDDGVYNFNNLYG